jgi:hypothetical protein
MKRRYARRRGRTDRPRGNDAQSRSASAGADAEACAPDQHARELTTRPGSGHQPINTEAGASALALELAASAGRNLLKTRRRALSVSQAHS